MPGYRMTAIWIGGGDYPAGGPEFNLMMDPIAANVVMKSRMPSGRSRRAPTSRCR
ncbi:MAG: hypothetical protein LKH04_09290 [Lachnospiraceae bacterium]|nr:hypothetical protein [Lachnospiraceae bacterium]MCI1398237.1 hypothetical protein [Lachnospiraceae bacterium]MCI1424471.1 hypothetical protein [Lachnospiraceae bacterium]MCI1453248.1 hypothetical protein [Lachnospiraceae bacterium]